MLGFPGFGWQVPLICRLKPQQNGQACTCRILILRVSLISISDLLPAFSSYMYVIFCQLVVTCFFCQLHREVKFLMCGYLLLLQFESHSSEDLQLTHLILSKRAALRSSGTAVLVSAFIPFYLTRFNMWCFTRQSCQPCAKPPTWRTRMLFSLAPLT